MTLHRDRILGKPLRPALDPALRARIADGIRAGQGRNALARQHGVSTGMVSKIARQDGLWFARCEHTATATEAHQTDAALQRVLRAEELWNLILTTPNRQDGTEPRRVRKASYELYNLDRHHNGRHPLP